MHTKVQNIKQPLAVKGDHHEPKASTLSVAGGRDKKVPGGITGLERPGLSTLECLFIAISQFLTESFSCWN